MNTLFTSIPIHYPIADGELTYYPEWLDSQTATELYECLHKEVDWQQTVLSMFGRDVPIPRLNAWYADKGCGYEYSGHYFEPNPWLPSLSLLREKLTLETGVTYNSVLVNCYRDGSDSVSWHSDDEPELGSNPTIASISLGERRVFHLKHKYDQQQERQAIQLEHGSLLVMSGTLQHFWQHQLPKTRRQVAGRINLTFRTVIQTTDTEKKQPNDKLGMKKV